MSKAVVIYRFNLNKPRPGNKICIYWTNFWQPTVHVQQKCFEKTFIEACSPHNYASFVTFCVQFGQLFEAQWVFKQSEEFRNRRYFRSMRSIFKHTSKTGCASNDRPKEAQRCGLQAFMRVISKIFFLRKNVWLQKIR